MGCGCEQRKAWLNEQRPGLGDTTERLIEIGVAALVTAGLIWLLTRADLAP